MGRKKSLAMRENEEEKNYSCLSASTSCAAHRAPFSTAMACTGHGELSRWF